MAKNKEMINMSVFCQYCVLQKGFSFCCSMFYPHNKQTLYLEKLQYCIRDTMIHFTLQYIQYIQYSHRGFNSATLVLYIQEVHGGVTQ